MIQNLIHPILKTLLFTTLCFLLACSKKETTTTTQQTDTLILSKADSNLLIAKKNFEQDSSENNYIWLGRRLGYLSRFDEAITIFTNGIEKYPESYALYRHRGHRYISKRQFDLAINDLNKAAKLMKGRPLEIEPDGIPNKLNKPLSSVQFNVWYHLALAYYLQGDFKKAETAYLECMKVSDNDDLLVATTDWLYMTYRKMNDKKSADKILLKITPSLEIIENDSYYKRLQMYQGKLPADSLLIVDANRSDADLSIATQGYGVGNWYLYNGDSAKAKEIFDRVLQGNSTASFGYIAAEVDRKRMN